MSHFACHTAQRVQRNRTDDLVPRNKCTTTASAGAAKPDGFFQLKNYGLDQSTGEPRQSSHKCKEQLEGRFGSALIA